MCDQRCQRWCSIIHVPTVGNKSASLGLVEALGSYQARRSRNAFVDGAVGGIAATYVLVAMSIKSWIDGMVKQSKKGRRPKQPEPLPSWVRAVTLPFAHAAARQIDGDLASILDAFLDEITSDRPFRVLRALLDVLETPLRFTPTPDNHYVIEGPVYLGALYPIASDPNGVQCILV